MRAALRKHLHKEGPTHAEMDFRQKNAAKARAARQEKSVVAQLAIAKSQLQATQGEWGVLYQRCVQCTKPLTMRLEKKAARLMKACQYYFAKLAASCIIPQNSMGVLLRQQRRTVALDERLLGALCWQSSHQLWH